MQNDGIGIMATIELTATLDAIQVEEVETIIGHDTPCATLLGELLRLSASGSVTVFLSGTDSAKTCATRPLCCAHSRGIE